MQKTNSDDNAFYIQKYQEHISCSFAYKIVCIDDRFNKSVVIYRQKMQSTSSLKQLFMTIGIVKGW